MDYTVYHVFYLDKNPLEFVGMEEKKPFYELPLERISVPQNDCSTEWKMVFGFQWESRAKKGLGGGRLHRTLAVGRTCGWTALIPLQLDLQNRTRKIPRTAYVPSHWGLQELSAIGCTIPLHNGETEAPWNKQLSSQISISLGAGLISACVQDNSPYNANFKTIVWELPNPKGTCWARATVSPGSAVRGIWETRNNS